jgi:hypothetical protein
MNQPEILFYNLTSSKGFKIEKLCKRLGVQVRHVKEEEYANTLGALCGRRVKVKQNIEESALGHSVLEDEMLVMAEFTEELLERFLKEFKTMHIEPVRLKAVLTEHNQAWTSYALHQELCKERDYYSEKSQE